MKAIATRIGKSKNESIEIDGKVWIKKTLIDAPENSWNFIARVKYDGNSVGAYCKSKSMAGIKKLIANYVVPVTSYEIAEVERER